MSNKRTRLQSQIEYAGHKRAALQSELEDLRETYQLEIQKLKLKIEESQSIQDELQREVGRIESAKSILEQELDRLRSGFFQGRKVQCLAELDSTSGKKLKKSLDLMKVEVSNGESFELLPNGFENRLKILEVEVQILNHQLSLAYQRDQTYKKWKLSNRNLVDEAVSPNLEELRAISPSQLGQDLWVLDKLNFKKNGFFVEFGATNGILLSNTFLLERYFGWRGICAEPNPKFYKELESNRSCIVSDACISGKSGEEVDFLLAGEYGGISKFAFSDSHADKRAAYEVSGATMPVKTESLLEFLLRLQSPRTIDYLSVDTEGSELEIIKNFPFQEWDIRIISVEHNYGESRPVIKELLTSIGYVCESLEWDDMYYLPCGFKLF